MVMDIHEYNEKFKGYMDEAEGWEGSCVCDNTRLFSCMCPHFLSMVWCSLFASSFSLFVFVSSCCVSVCALAMFCVRIDISSRGVLSVSIAVVCQFFFCRFQ